MLKIFLSFFVFAKVPVQKEIHKKTNDYLRGITSIAGGFSQTNPDGEKIQGYFWLKRPKGKSGKIRIDYVNGQRIYANDKDVVIYDLKNKTKTDPISTQDTPATFLLIKRIDLSEFDPFYKIKKDEIQAILKTKNADVTLYFELYPKTHNIKYLKGWKINDIQENITTVHFDTRTIHINNPSLVSERLFLE
jgi:outer membrane lipoprotein-sorting protein